MQAPHLGNDYWTESMVHANHQIVNRPSVAHDWKITNHSARQSAIYSGYRASTGTISPTPSMRCPEWHTRQAEHTGMYYSTYCSIYTTPEVTAWSSENPLIRPRSRLTRTATGCRIMVMNTIIIDPPPATSQMLQATPSCGDPADRAA